MAGVEKRKFKRVRVEQDIRVRWGDLELVGCTTNVSLGGVGFRVDLSMPPRVGERVHVSFDVPALDAPLEAEAEVRWSGGPSPSTIGVQFVTGLRARQTWALGRWLESLEAEQGDE